MWQLPYMEYRVTKGLCHVRVLQHLGSKQIGREMANVNQMTRTVLQDCNCKTKAPVLYLSGDVDT